MELRLDTGYRQILRMALPISLSMVVPQINFITNNIFLGGLGEHALASAGITGVYYLVFAVIGNGLSNGLQSLMATRAGQNMPHEIGKLFFHGVWIAVVIALLGILATQTIASVILRSVIHEKTIADQVVDFLMIRIWGLPFLYLYVMRNALLVGTAQTQLLVWGTVAEATVNIFLDYALIYGKWGFPRLGFNGAAYASITAEATGLLVIYLVIHGRGIHKKFAFFNDTRIDSKTFRQIFSRSSPLIAQFAISILVWEYFYILVEHYGSRALAISNTMRNIFGVFGIFAWAFASTTNTMVSNVMGQRRYHDVMPLVKRIAGISLLFAVVMCALLNAFPGWVLSFYAQSRAFVEEAIPVIRVVSVAFVLMSVGSVCLNAVVGIGKPIVNLCIELITVVVYCVYVYLVLDRWHLSITWGWISEWVYWTSMLGLAGAYLLYCNAKGFGSVKE